VDVRVDEARTDVLALQVDDLSCPIGPEPGNAALVYGDIGVVYLA